MSHIGSLLDHPLPRVGPRISDVVGPLVGPGPLYRQVAEALKAAIDRGEVPLGTVLPPERVLAEALAVSRSTVVAAYDRLKAEGWLASRRGSGTWVREPARPARGGVDAVATGKLFLSRPVPAAPSVPPPAGADDGIADLSVAAVTGSPTVAAVLGSLTTGDVAPLLEHHGYLPQGLPALRAAVVDRFAAGGLATEPDRVVVTNGAHQAISLVARQTLEAGDVVVVESPTFPGALDIFRRFGARPVPLPVDDEGARADVLEDLVRRLHPKLVFLTPTFHSPTGAVMSERRRREIARVVDDSATPLVEDLALADLALDDDLDVPAPIAAYAAGDTVHTIGSTAKLFWAGLRIGWVHSPESWRTRMLSTKTVADLGSPILGQLLAARLLGHTDEVVAERRAELRPRRDLLDELLRDRLPDWSWRRPAGGLSLWVDLGGGNAEEFAELAQQHGVRVVPGPSLSVDDGNRRALRLTYAPPERVLERAVTRLATAWSAYTATTSRSSARLLV
jgi:DNA-binding transcriptional MocR family regulator